MGKKCKICGKDSETFLYIAPPLKPVHILFVSITVGSPPYLDLCTEHLVSEFTQRFLAYPHKMVVFTPYFPQQPFLSYGYEFIPSNCSASTRTTRQGAFSLLISTNLSLITGNCQACGQEARVAFFDKESIHWRGELAEPDDAKLTPKILCKECVGKSLKDVLQENAKHFSEGIWSPWGGEGGFCHVDY